MTPGPVDEEEGKYDGWGRGNEFGLEKSRSFEDMLIFYKFFSDGESRFYW